jgi:hypothetical protein
MPARILLFGSVSEAYAVIVAEIPGYGLVATVNRTQP